MKYISRRRTGYFGAAMVAMGLLLWARFLLITGHPKTAMATPEAPSSAASSIGDGSTAPASAKPDQPVRRSRPQEQSGNNTAATSSAGH